MSTATSRQRFGSSGVIGAPLDRVDGRLKVTGGARYAAEHPIEGLAHAVIVGSTIARGRITRLDATAAEAAPGVLGVVSHLNAPRLPEMKSFLSGEGSTIHRVPPIQDAEIHYAGQHIAVVVAETLEQAMHATRLVQVEYEEQPPITGLRDHLSEAYPNEPFFGGIPPEVTRGDPARGLAEADVRVEQTYTTPIEHHNPMEPSATIAVWDDDGALTVYDATQGVYGVKQAMVEAFGLAEDKVRVIAPFLGGGFGCKGTHWPHITLAVLAARQVGRPVKLQLTRAQMYTSIGYRSETLQEIGLGARRDGTLTAIVHDSTSIGSDAGEFPETTTELTKVLYACPNVRTKTQLVRLSMGVPGMMRAPGEASGSFALESAMDELAYELGMDPIELRLRNYAETDPESGTPWSSKALRECYAQGAERFGWARRTPEPGSMRDGRMQVGYGMATASHPTVGFPAQAKATIRADGTALVQSATADLGTGQYTVMTQVASDALGLGPDRVTFELGDTALPFAMVAGGSSGARSVGPAVKMAAEAVKAKAVDLAMSDEDSPLAGYGSEAVGVEDGELFLKHDPSKRESYGAILARRGVEELTGEGGVGMVGDPEGHKVNAFGAQFVEVRVDPDLGLVRVARALGAFGIGTVLNAKTARGQGIGGIVWGIGMALLEHTSIHPRLGKVASPNLSGYLVPVHADIPAVDAFFVEEHDPYVNSLGVKGVGEIGIVGVAAAIANAVHHATGKRVRDLPITPEKLL